MRKKPAFTLIELLIVIGIIAVLTTILIPVITTSIADSHITVCATKLGTIVDAFAKYADDTSYGGFPRLATKGDPDDPIGAGTSTNDLKVGDPLAYNTAVLGTNTMQNVWLLIEAGYLPAAAFQCPGDGDYLSKLTQTRYGWDSWYQFSYGMQNPYDTADPGPTPENKAVPVSTKTYKANYVFFADMNPGGPASTSGQSNHSTGCNVATRNGNVWFHEKEDSSVVYGEEIYDDTGGIADDWWPDTSLDVVITPTAPLAARIAELGG